MSKEIVFRIGLVICVLFIAACSTFEVRTDFDTDYEFSETATYVWDTGVNQTENLSMQRFHSAVKAVLLEKRMMHASARQTAPLTVRLKVFTEGRKEVRPTTSVGLWVGVGDELYWNDYELDWFVVEFIETGQERIVWEGKASARTLNDLTPQERDLRTEEAARELLKLFPPVKNLD